MRTTHATTARTAHRLVGLVAVVALAATACGDDDDTDASASEDASTEDTGAADDAGDDTDTDTDTDDDGDGTDSTGDDDGGDDSDAGTNEGTDDDGDGTDSTGDDEEAAADDTAGESAGSGDGILVDDEPNRFFELDWQVVDTRRQPDGPGDEGEDVDPTEDFVYVDLDVSSALEATTLSIPYEWVSLVAPDGVAVRPVEGLDRGSGSRLGLYIDAEPNRTQEVTVVFAVDADAGYDGGWVEVDQDGYLAAALAGPQRMDEAARLPASFDTTTYVGPFSRDEATVEIVDAYWSRELGLEDDGELVESPDNSSRRPAVDEAWLLVHFTVTCELTGINTGGCNVYGGQVVVDGEGRTGSVVNGTGPYEATEDFWAAYPVPVDAGSVVVEIGEPEDGINTSFAVTDLAPLQSLATPQL